MKIKSLVLLIGIIVSGAAGAADYSVGISNTVPGVANCVAGQGSVPTTGLNLYWITGKGASLVKGSPYFLESLTPSTTYKSYYQYYCPTVVTMNTTHDFVYVTYMSDSSLPYLVGFKITPQGLVYQWVSEINSGDALLGAGGTIVAGTNYVIETVRPFGVWVYVLNQQGVQIVADAGSNGDDLVSGHISQDEKFYYSCRKVTGTFNAASGPANTVAIFDLTKTTAVYGAAMVTSTDPAFVQSECGPFPVLF